MAIKIFFRKKLENQHRSIHVFMLFLFKFCHIFSKFT